MNVRSKNLACTVIALLIHTENAFAQPGWQSIDEPTCSAANGLLTRVAFAMAYDVARDRIVLFGGKQVGGPRLGDTWEWDGQCWTRLSPPNSPSARQNHAMAYDESTSRVVLFGGTGIGSNEPLGDTWTWDGTTWTQVSSGIPTGTAPCARTDHAMVYDSARQEVVLFGGQSTNGPPCSQVWFRDTWAWKNNTWSLRAASTSNSPPARTGFRMAFDRARSVAVLCGGYIGPTAMFDNDTWEWNGATWSQFAPANSPSPREYAAVVFDRARNRTIYYGGSDGMGGVYGDQWEWDGVNWVQFNPAAASPGARQSSEMVFDPQRQCVVLHGGITAAPASGTDTWGFAQFAQFVTLGPGCPGSNGTPTMTAPSGGPVLGEPFTVRVTNLPLPALPPIWLVGFAPLQPAVPLGLLGLPGCSLYVAGPLIQPTTMRSTVNVAEGTGTLPALPQTNALLGASFFSQFAVIDSLVNPPLNLTLSNGAQHVIGWCR